MTHLMSLLCLNYLCILVNIFEQTQGHLSIDYRNHTWKSPSRFRRQLGSEFDTCGIQYNGALPLMMGSERVNRGDYPWLVALFLNKNNIISFRCVASLVSKQHVLTAAHCTFGNNPNDFILKLGIHNVHDWADENVKISNIKYIQYHPEFTSSRVVGWGLHDHHQNRSTITPEPRKAEIPVVSTDTCRASSYKFHFVTDNMTICAGNKNNVGPCSGDSGGGLYIKKNGRWMIRGIVSRSLKSKNDTCDLSEYVVFTDVAKYNPWIKEVIDICKSTFCDISDCKLPERPISGSYSVHGASSISLQPGDTVSEYTALKYSCDGGSINHETVTVCVKGRWNYNIECRNAEQETEVEANMGDVAALKCLVYDNSAPTITWRKGAMLIDGKSGRYKILSDGTLQIISLYKSDSGVYTCVAANEVGPPVQRNVNLQVADPIQKPADVLPGETHIIGNLGSPLKLRCLAYGYPTPSVQWWHSDNMLLSNSRDYGLNPSEHSLYIKALKETQLGTYTCKADNGVGVTRSWSIIVQGVRIDNPIYTYEYTPPTAEREEDREIPYQSSTWNHNDVIADYIKVCQRTDPNVDECIINSIYELKPKLRQGIPELNIPSMEPLLMKEIVPFRGRNALLMKINITDIKVTGSSDFQILNLKSDLINNRFDFRFLLPRLYYEGKYDTDMVIGILPLRGNGEVNGNFTNFLGNVTMKGHKKTVNGKIYLKFDMMKVNVNFEDGRIYLSNLLNVSLLKPLADIANSFLNEYSKLILAELTPVLEKSLEDLFTDISNRITLKYTYQELFP